ncbi:MAG: O-acetyl-ADP-ribose deacetylase [Phycisphaerae bacterium]|nr:O-acetyl-ADP-ribose deacetylase [Phycisphaerae bacterium]
MISPAGRIIIKQGDITQEAVDAIVNAANESLLGGGGVDGAIHRAAGPQLLEFCRTLGGCPTGGAKITPGFNLPARFVIHTVGPVYRDGQSGEPELLAHCYRNSLQLAYDHHFPTIAFPAISCGVYGYPITTAAHIALQTVARFLSEFPLPQEVRFLLWSSGDLAVYQQVYTEIRSAGGEAIHH